MIDHTTEVKPSLPARAGFPRLTGLVAAAHTPFGPDGRLNLDAVERQAAHLSVAGVRGVFVGGSTGEGHSLTVEERRALARRWVEVARGTGLAVIVHVGHNSQGDARSLAEAAAQSGAQAIAALAPSYYKPARTEDLVGFLAPVAAAAPALPFYYYDIPALTGVHVPLVEFLVRGREAMPTLAGIKYTNPDPTQWVECFGLDGGFFDILYGIDEGLLAGLALGAEGAVGSSYNFAAPIYHRLIAAFRRGDWKTAREEQARSIRLIRLLARFGYMVAAKHMMGLLGVDCGTVRPPLRPLADEEKKVLERELQTSGFWDDLRRR